MIARILHGGMVAQQGLLHVGDIIKEVNGQPVGSDPRALQELLRSASGSVILKILPSYQEPHLPRQVGPPTEVPTQHKARGVAETPSCQGHRPRGGSPSSSTNPTSKMGDGVSGDLGVCVWREPSHLAAWRVVHMHVLAVLPWSWALMQGMCAHSRPGVPGCTNERLHCMQLSACLCMHGYAESDCQAFFTAASGLVDCGGSAALPTSIGSLAVCQSLLLQGGWGG